MSFKIVAKNTFYQTFARLAGSFIGFLVTILIASKFGVLIYGDFIKVTSFVSLFYLFVDFGINAIFLQNEQNKFKDIFTIRIIISSFIFIICNLIAFFLPYNNITGIGFSQNLKLAIFIFSFSIFTQGIIYSASLYFQKKLNYFNYMLAVLVGSFVNLLFVFILMFLNYSILYVFVSFLLGSLVTSLILLIFIKEEMFNKSLSKKLFKEIIISALPLGFMLVFNFIYFRIDTFLLSVLSSTTAVGIYGLSYKFFDFLIALPLFLSNAIYPFLLKANREKRGMNNLVIKYFFVFLGASMLIIIPFWFMSPLFSLIKPEFIKSVLPFRILLLSLPFFFITSLLQWVLITIKQQKYLMYVYLLLTVLNILLNIIFIPKFSYIASSYLTVLTEGLVLLFLLIKIYLEREKIYV